MNLKRWWNCRCGIASGPGVDDDSWLLPLAEASPGRRVKVKRISGGRGLCARMAALGIYPGAELELLCAGCDSPCLVRVRGGTLSLGKGVSDKILVTPALL
jgi:ferrous iron transport protein A